MRWTGLPSKPVMLAVRVPVLALAAILAWGCAAPSRPVTPPVATGPVAPPATPAAPPLALPPSTLTEAQQALHVLSRLTYGARPSDLEAVGRVGLAAWIDSQLRPERLDDHVAEARVAALRVPGLSPRALMDAFPPPNLERRPGM